MPRLYKRINRRLLCRAFAALAPYATLNRAGSVCRRVCPTALTSTPTGHATVGSGAIYDVAADEPGGCHEHNEACGTRWRGRCGCVDTYARSARRLGAERALRTRQSRFSNRVFGNTVSISPAWSASPPACAGAKVRSGSVMGVICFGATRRTTASCVGTRRLERSVFSASRQTMRTATPVTARVDWCHASIPGGG